MTKQVIPPPTPPHLAKGHNCQNPRCRSLRSGALQPTPPETSKKQRKGGEAHSRPHPRQADHARNPRIRCTGAAGNHPPTAQGEHSRATTRAHHPAHPHPHLSKGHTCPNPPRATAHTIKTPAQKKGGPHDPLQIVGPSPFGVRGTLLTHKAPPPTSPTKQAG